MVLSEGGSLSSSQRIVALGGERRAPKQLSEGCRWVGGEDAEIDETLASECAEGTEGGKVTDLNFHYKFFEKDPGFGRVHSESAEFGPLLEQSSSDGESGCHAETP